MRYAYYPGCSLKATARMYDMSTRAVAKVLGIEFVELDDWNCCGATTYMSVQELLSMSISARNLSLAQKTGMDLVAPCSACFTVLRKADHYLHDMPELKNNVSSVLQAAGLSYDAGSVKVRHVLEVMALNGGIGKLRDLTKNPLKGLRVAPYYGCQIVRPRVDWDDPEMPTVLDDVLRSIGASPVYYPVKSRCCGASLMASNENAAYRLCKNLLLCAVQNKADCIVTVCPLCQMNLDAFQGKVNKMFGTNFNIPILYFTQLVGVAMGLTDHGLGLGLELVQAKPVLERFRQPAAARSAS